MIAGPWFFSPIRRTDLARKASIRQAKTGSHRLVGNRPAVDVNRGGNRVRFSHGSLNSMLCDADDPRQRDIAQCEGARPPDRARHISHAVMHHVLLDISRITMRSRTAGFEA